MTSERLLTRRELADLIGFSSATVQDWFEAGQLPGFRIGGRLRFRASEVEAWLEERRRGPVFEPQDGDPERCRHFSPRTPDKAVDA
jgi:excisionase family DNA binding protein